MFICLAELNALPEPVPIASRSAKEVCDEGRGAGPGGLGVYLDFSDSIIVRRQFPRRIPDRRGEALRNDDEFCHVAAWQFNGENQ